MEHLRTQICYNIGLYAEKYCEEFDIYVQQFVTDVCELLVKTGIQTKYDAVSENFTNKYKWYTFSNLNHLYIAVGIKRTRFFVNSHQTKSLSFTISKISVGQNL